MLNINDIKNNIKIPTYSFNRGSKSAVKYHMLSKRTRNRSDN